MASILSLPSELIQSFDDLTRLKLSLVCKHLYSLIPEYKEHLMYPDYIAALERRDFMCIYRHKDSRSCYTGEKLNLDEDHLLIKYLSLKDHVYHEYTPNTDELAYAYEITPAMICALHTFNIESLVDIIDHKPHLCMGIVIEAIKCNHVFVRRLVNVIADLREYKKTVIYHLVKHNIWNSADLPNDIVSRTYLYAYGHISIEQALADDDHLALAVMSKDYPDTVVEYILEQKSDTIAETILVNASQVNSPILAKYISRVGVYKPFMLNSMKIYVDEEIVDALFELDGSLLLTVLRVHIYNLGFTWDIAEKYKDYLVDYIDEIRDIFIVKSLTQHLRCMDVEYAIRLIKRQRCDELYDKIFSLLSESLDPHVLTDQERYHLAVYFLQKNNYPMAAHFMKA